MSVALNPHFFKGGNGKDSIEDGCIRYFSYDFECSLGFTFFINSRHTVLSRFISSTVTSTMFIIIPAGLCVYYYYQSVSVLYTRKKKVGRNLNLIFCFATVCIIWWFTFFVRYALAIYSMLFYLNVPIRKEYQYPVLRNLYTQFFLNNFSSFSSLFNPFLVLLAQTDYRQPFLKRKEKILNKLRNLLKTEGSSNANVSNRV